MTLKDIKPAYYVTMTDKHLSGWGRAAGKINKLVFECFSYDEAEIVASNAAKQGSQKFINITSKKPYYKGNRYYVNWYTKENQGWWYKNENK